jgi:hypothetical protein
MMTMYQDLGFLLDYLFAMARTPHGEYTEDKSNTMKRIIASTFHMWRYLRLSTKGTKFHGVEDHLEEQMSREKSIGDYTEDFVEQAHQGGVQDEYRTKGLSRWRAFNSHCNWEKMRLKVGVIEAKERVKQSSTRKRKSRSENDKTKQKWAKVIRDNKRKESLERVERGVYTMIDDCRKNANTTQSNDDEEDGGDEHAALQG